MEYEITTIKKILGVQPDLKVLQDIGNEIEKICEDTIKDVMDDYARKKEEEGIIGIDKELSQLEALFREEFAPLYTITGMPNRNTKTKITFRSVVEWMTYQDILDERFITEIALSLRLKRIVTKSGEYPFPEITISVIWQRRYRNEVAIRVSGPKKEFVDNVFNCLYKIIPLKESESSAKGELNNDTTER